MPAAMGEGVAVGAGVAEGVGTPPGVGVGVPTGVGLSVGEGVGPVLSTTRRGEMTQPAMVAMTSSTAKIAGRCQKIR